MHYILIIIFLDYDCFQALLTLSMQQDFFRKLMDVFRICEDLENIEGLHMIYKIVRGISKYSSLIYAIYFHVLIVTDWFNVSFSFAQQSSDL